jgi:hypothetical protein
MNNNYYVSLPNTIQVPPQWTETPKKEDRINSAARSCLESWSDSQLKKTSIALGIGSAVSIIGLGVSLFWVLIPTTVFSCAAFCVCFLGIGVIGSEQKRREINQCQKTCFEIEDELIQLEETSNGLNDFLSKTPKDELFKPDNQKQLLQLLQNFSEESLLKLKGLSERLREHHQHLFGNPRSIGNRSYSDHWISSYFQNGFYYHLKYMNGPVSELQIYMKELRDNETLDKEEVQKDVIAYIDLISDYFKTRKTGMFLAHAPKEFATITEEIEYWRQNIAAFRHSLDDGSLTI